MDIQIQDKKLKKIGVVGDKVFTLNNNNEVTVYMASELKSYRLGPLTGK